MGGSKWAIGGTRNWGVIVAEQTIGEKPIGGQVVGEQANLGASGWEVLKIKNTLRNEWEIVFFHNPSACH